MVTFEYSPINLEGLDFRLVRLEAGTGPTIKCELVHASLDRDVIIPYEAVSYTWGSPFKDDIIDIQGSQLHITTNLSLILHDLRSPNEDRILWIDAICIDQENLEERGHQVRQMSGIYNRAERVLFCLGRPTETTHIVMTSLAELQRQCSGARWASEDRRWKEVWVEAETNLQKTYSHLQDRLRQGLVHLLAQPWFRRVWILQEVANSRAAFVYCGTEHIPASFFALCPRLIGVEPDPHCQAVLDMMPMKPRSESEWSQGQDLYCLLRNFAAAEAQDNRDKIFALLGMCKHDKGRDTLIADYKKSVRAVIRETISYICFFDANLLQYTPYTTMPEFMSGIEHLNNTMLRYLAESCQPQQMRIVESLFQGRGQYITITSDVVEAAAGNRAGGKDIIELFLKERGEEVKITERAVEAAAGNEMQGKDLIELFLNLRGEQVRITERAVEAAAGNEMQGKDLIELFLNLRGEQVRITERTLEAAAGNEIQGKDLIEIFLKQRLEEVMVTQRVLGAASRNSDWVKREEVIKLLLSRLEEEIVNAAAAANTVLGKRLVALLLMYQMDAKIKDEMFKAATTNGGGPELLLWAAKKGNHIFIQRLLQQSVDIKVENNDGKESLWRAITKGHESIVRVLLEECSKIKPLNDSGENPLTWAIDYSYQIIFRLLLKEGANVKALNDSGERPLFWAIDYGYETIFRLLLEEGANVKAQNSSGEKLLIWAVRHGHESTVRLLLKEGANIEAQDAYGETPLIYAIKHRRKAIIRLLVKRGADIKAEDKFGGTPLTYAKSNGKGDIVRLLLRKGANGPTSLQRVYKWCARAIGLCFDRERR